MHKYRFQSFFLVLACTFAGQLSGKQLALSINETTIHLTNQHIQLEIIKTSGAIKKLFFKDTNLIGSGRGYMQSNDQNGFMSPQNAKLIVTRNDKSMIDIGFAHQSEFAVDYEFHYVLRPGESGFYNYIVWGSRGKKTGNQVLSQLNYALRLNPDLFTHYTVNSEIAALPSLKALKESKSVMDATFKLKDGSIYTKYNHSATMDESHNVHGLLSKKFGAWVIMPSHEHLNGAPFNTELTLHQTNRSPILLRHAQAAHHGSGTAKICEQDGPWEKWGGPWFFYFNHDGSMKARSHDAKKLANQMTQDWPFDWISDDRFKSERGTLIGQLIDPSGSPIAGARIVISKSAEGERPKDFQQLWKGYRFFGWTDSNGYFKLKNVWPDKYDLFAMQNDISGLFVRYGFNVNENKITDAGKLTWKIPAPEQKLWQIGTLDRSAAEFAYGQDYKHWGLWMKIAEEFPGQIISINANSATPKNLPHMLAAFQKTDGTTYTPELHIDFNLKQAPTTENANLLIAITDAIQHRGKIVDLEIYMNGSHVTTTQQAFRHGGAIHRSGIRGLCQKITIPIHTKYFKLGNNSLEIHLKPKSNDGNSFTGAPQIAVMWDAIALELDSHFAKKFDLNQ